IFTQFERLAFLLDFSRCLYHRGVLAELQGCHRTAQGMFETAMTTMEKVLYQRCQANNQPFALILAGKLQRARVHAKLDKQDAVAELLTQCSLQSTSAEQHLQHLQSQTPFLAANGIHSAQLCRMQALPARDADDDLSSRLQQLDLD